MLLYKCFGDMNAFNQKHRGFLIRSSSTETCWCPAVKNVASQKHSVMLNCNSSWGMPEKKGCGHRHADYMHSNARLYTYVTHDLVIRPYSNLSDWKLIRVMTSSLELKDIHTFWRWCHNLKPFPVTHHFQMQTYDRKCNKIAFQTIIY